MIQNDILTNLSTINSQQSIQKYYNLFIGKDLEKSLTSICNSNFVSYTLLTLSKNNFDRYSSIFGRKKEYLDLRQFGAYFLFIKYLGKALIYLISLYIIMKMRLKTII